MHMVMGHTDTLKVRNDQRAAGEQSHLWPSNDGRIPFASHVMTERGWERALSWLSNVEVPSSFGVKPVRMFHKFRPGKFSVFACKTVS
jgi:hypothetical protein